MTRGESAGDDARCQPRSSLFLTAVLHSQSKQIPVKVRNLSPNGALIEAELTLPAGSTVELVRGRLSAKGAVVWTSETRCGLRFSDELLIKEWLAAPAKPEQRRVDEIVSLIKAGTILPKQNWAEFPSAEQTGLPNPQLVEDLVSVEKLIQELEDDLTSSAETLVRHGAKLQNLDIALQMLRSIAQQFLGSSVDQPANAASLGNLRVVCGQALRLSDSHV